MTPKEKFQKAKIALLLDQPFFGSLLMNLECRKAPVETMSTNGKDLKWSEKFVEILQPVEIKSVLAHEVLHCALLHHLRRGNRDTKAWNVACDYVVNQIIIDSPGFQLPQGALIDPSFKGKCAEELYQEPQPGDKQNNKPGQGSPSCGEVEDSPEQSDESKVKEEEANWKVALTQATNMAKAMGKLPAGMERLVEEVLNPKTPWQEVLKNLVREIFKNDYCWSRPNRRYLQSGFIMPSLYSENLGPLVIGIDTSGSIDDTLLNKFISEVESIVHECRPSKVILIDCDTEIGKIQEFEPGDILPRKFGGGGGTSFRPVFDYVKTIEDPVGLIYLTDLEGSFPKEEPSYPVFWATYGGCSRYPWGTLVPIE
jgi:predicted metal-dependent peptidase